MNFYQKGDIIACGVDFTNLLWAVFTRPEPKSKKRHWCLLFFLRFTRVKASCKHVGEIDTCCLTHTSKKAHPPSLSATPSFTLPLATQPPHTHHPSPFFKHRDWNQFNFPSTVVVTKIDVCMSNFFRRKDVCAVTNDSLYLLKLRRSEICYQSLFLWSNCFIKISEEPWDLKFCRAFSWIWAS